MKTYTMRRALVLANIFNLLAGVYLIIISIVALIQLRWYHQLTITIRVRHLVTSSTSYFAFLILLLVGLNLVLIFALNVVRLSPRHYVSPAGLDAIERPEPNLGDQTDTKTRLDDERLSPLSNRLVLTNSSLPDSSISTFCCLTFLHLSSSVGLIVILVIWLLNTGELVRDSISSQLEFAFNKYQFNNRSNHYSVAIDGMQFINNCCGSLNYSDFPHQRSGLSSGQYPGSCCNKNVFGANARVVCVPEEIVRVRQTSGCVTVLSNYYDLISLLVVPVSLVCLFVNITVIAIATITRGHNSRQEPTLQRGNAKFELRTSS